MIEFFNNPSEIISQLKSQGAGSRMELVEALAQSENPIAVEPLIYCLKDEDDFIRSLAMVGLGRLKDPRAVEPLIECLNDIPMMREYAACAIRNITGKSFFFWQPGLSKMENMVESK